MKIFISYSWTPESNKKKVNELVQKLHDSGFEVIIDQTHLKYGYDKYAFMERMITDPSISKVLIICNKDYTQKADNRIGGVGDESMIITPELYGKVEQSKFIPVVFEKDRNGNPYLPVYLKRIMHVDLSNKKQYDTFYYRLVQQMREPFFCLVCECLKKKGFNFSIKPGEIVAEFEIGNSIVDHFITLITDNGILLFINFLLSEIPADRIKYDILNNFSIPYGEFSFDEESDAEETLNLVYTYGINKIDSDTLQKDVLSFLDWLESDYREIAAKIIATTIKYED